MKVLTIKEPYASLIINGYKMYEFRSWKTNYRGKILIHAGKSTDKNKIDLFDEYNLNNNNGYIIGEVELVDCIKVDCAIQDMLNKINSKVYGNNNHVGVYAWKLDNIIKYKKEDRIKINGKLGLWNLGGYDEKVN